MADFATSPLTPDRWDDLVEVFGGGDGKGDCGRCWCMWWRLDRHHLGALDGTDNKASFRARVDAGPPPGLVGYDGDVPVGWVQVGPRSDVPRWNDRGRLTAPPSTEDATDPGIWGISCFVVRAGYRKRGHGARLLDGAVEWARQNDARFLDACPVDATSGTSASALFHGIAHLFLQRGFKEIARRKANRPVVRMALK